MTYRDEDWPHGLMCCRCPHVFIDGEEIATEPVGVIDGVPGEEIVCTECAESWR